MNIDKYLHNIMKTFKSFKQYFKFLTEDINTKLPILIKQFQIKFNLSEEELKQLILKYAEFDPTLNKDYITWILKSTLNPINKLRLPEDGQRLLKVLKNFEYLKKKKKLKNSDINSFKSLQDLERELENYKNLLPIEEPIRRIAGNIEPASDLIKPNKGLDLLMVEGIYKVYRITEPSVCLKMQEGTEWCTRNPNENNYARDYIKDGPLIQINKNNKPYILIHEASGQAKGVNDSAIDIRLVKEILPIIKKLYDNKFIKEFKDELQSFDVFINWNKHKNTILKYIKDNDITNLCSYIKFYPFEDQNLNKMFINKLKEFQDKVDWNWISVYQNLSEDFIRKFKDKVDWKHISRFQKLSEDFIREFKDKVDWFYISRYQKLSENFIREFKDKVDWFYISGYQKLSEDFIREFKDKVYWFYISGYQKLSEDFIREFKYEVYWDLISADQNLSENFIREFKNKVDWNWISVKQKLSENFIREFKNKVAWNWISGNQKLSEDFIREFKDKVDWNLISAKQKLSPEFRKEFNI